jgi:hypothetical protein
MLKVRAANPMRTNVVSTIPPVFPEARSAFSSGGSRPQESAVRSQSIAFLVRVAVFLCAEPTLAGSDGALADYADADLILLARWRG